MLPQADFVDTKLVKVGGILSKRPCSLAFSFFLSVREQRTDDQRKQLKIGVDQKKNTDLTEDMKTLPVKHVKPQIKCVQCNRQTLKKSHPAFESE